MKATRLILFLFCIVMMSANPCLFPEGADDVNLILKVPIRVRNIMPEIEKVGVVCTLVDHNNQMVCMSRDWDVEPLSTEIPEDGRLQHIFVISKWTQTSFDANITDAIEYVCRLTLDGEEVVLNPTDILYKCKNGSECVLEVRGPIRW